MEQYEDAEIRVMKRSATDDDFRGTSSLCDQAACQDPEGNNTQPILPSNPASVNHCGEEVTMSSLPQSMMESALNYARRGFRVLPLGGKIPLVKGGYKTATTDEAIIRGWLSKWPNANIGIATGAVSKLLVVDVDPRNGGSESLARLRPLLEGDNGSIITPTAMTGGGGIHFYFACDVPVKSCQLANFPGIDILADHKSVVAVPSVHPDTNMAYHWHLCKSPQQVPLAPVPRPLLMLINQGRSTTKDSNSNSDEAKNHPLHGFPDGRRQDGLRDYAWSLRQQGRSQTEALALVRIAASQCNPPYEQHRAEGLVISAVCKAIEGESQIEIISLPELMDKELPPPKFTIAGILPEGLVLLSALPKKGKSTLARNMALSVARGTQFADRFSTKQGSVLYLSLEEGERAVRQCFVKMTNGNNLPPSLDLSFQWRQGEEAIEPIERWIESVESPRMIVVDLLQRVRPPTKATEGVYAYDARTLAPFHDLANRNSGLTVLVVHHHNKREVSENQERISGSTALTGGTDCNLTLERREGKEYCILRGSGRLIGEFEHLFVFDQDTHRLSWREPSHFVTSFRQKQVLDLLREVGEPMSVSDIQKELGENGIRILLSRMCKEGLIKRTGRGRYEYIDRSSDSQPDGSQTQSDPLITS